MELLDFWAKTSPFQSVVTHGLISGTVAQFLLTTYLSKGNREHLERTFSFDAEKLHSFMGYLVSLHDIGKIEYSFQVGNDQTREALNAMNLQELYIPHVRHEKTGQMCLRTIWKNRGEDRRSTLVFSKIIGAHHQGKNGDGNFKEKSVWWGYQNAFEELMRKHFLNGSELCLPSFEKEEQGSVSAMVLGLLILSDWISSGILFEDAEEWIWTEQANKKIETIAYGFLTRSGLMPAHSAWPEGFCKLWPNIPESGMRPLQKKINNIFASEKENTALVLIEAPMGEGKTEAGMYAAMRMAQEWHKDGVYVALPTAATSNQMVGRIRELFRMHVVGEKIRLLHSMAWLEETRSEEIHSHDEQYEVEKWLAPVKRGLLGQYSVGTVDQAMFSATNIKYGVLRLLGLSNKVLLIDEIHSYDAYMSEIIVRLLEWCKALEIPVVLLSATLPPRMKKKLLAPYTSEQLSGEYPLITRIDRDGNLHESLIGKTSHHMKVNVRFNSILGCPEKIADEAVSTVKDGGCLCVLMNTVRSAQRVYCEIKKRFDGDLLLFHAQFPAGRRAEIEAECLKKYGKDKRWRPKRSILVATQVVEQSLDVDFDVMITEVAPIDLLLQRTGRVFRHDHTPRPKDRTLAELIILVPENGNAFGSSAAVYPECLLNSSIRVLSGASKINIPEDIPVLVRDGYDPNLARDDEIEQWIKHQIKEQVEAGASQQYLLGAPDKMYSALDGLFPYEDDENNYAISAKTRLGEPAVRIALLKPKEMDRLRPFLKETNTGKIAAVWDKRVAEDVLKQSVSVRVSRIGGTKSVLSDIKGDILLLGSIILPLQDGVYRSADGKIIQFDPELGLLIEDGKNDG